MTLTQSGSWFRISGTFDFTRRARPPSRTPRPPRSHYLIGLAEQRESVIDPRVHGPLKLWDGVEEAVSTRQPAGKPDRSKFGLTVTRQGQKVWLSNPDGPLWSLPA